MKCQHCKKNKPLKDFSRNRAFPRGYQGYCKLCAKAAYDKCVAKDPERAKEVVERSFTKFYGTIKGRAVHMLNNAQARSRRRGMPCTITRDWLERKLRKGTCEATGLTFAWLERTGRGHRINSFAPSLDRRNCNKGYTPNNCRMVVWIYNRTRGAFSQIDFDKMVVAYVQQHIRLAKQI